jgi:hypothetical protein
MRQVRSNLGFVLLAYLDESDSPKRYFVAGVLVPDTEARSLTAALDGVVEEASYEHGRIASSAELHGHEIVNATKAQISGRRAAELHLPVGDYLRKVLNFW